MSFQLSSSLNLESIFADFSQLGHAHIANVLPSENAKRIHKGMLEKTPWNLAFNDGAKHVDLSAAQLHSAVCSRCHRLRRHQLHRCAVFNFTPEWRIDRGGYLQLLDESGDIHRGFIPAFNALNILAVPQKHNVSLVAPFAGGVRLSISGWFRYGEKPKPAA